jgi:hypothetical protein
VSGANEDSYWQLLFNLPIGVFSEKSFFSPPPKEANLRGDRGTRASLWWWDAGGTRLLGSLAGSPSKLWSVGKAQLIIGWKYRVWNILSWKFGNTRIMSFFKAEFWERVTLTSFGEWRTEEILRTAIIFGIRSRKSKNHCLSYSFIIEVNFSQLSPNASLGKHTPSQPSRISY